MHGSSSPTVGAVRMAQFVALSIVAAWSLAAPPRTTGQEASAPRPMTFLDMQQVRQVGSPAPSPDGRWMLYTLSTPDWKEAKRQTDVSGVADSRASRRPGK